MHIIHILYTHPIFTPQLENEKIIQNIEDRVGNRKPVYFYNRIPAILSERNNDVEYDEEIEYEQNQLVPFIRGIAASHADSIFPSNEHIFVNPFGLMLILDREKLYEYLASMDNIHLYYFDFLRLDYQNFLECYTNTEENNDNEDIMSYDQWEETNDEIEEFVRELNYLTAKNTEKKTLH